MDWTVWVSKRGGGEIFHNFPGWPQSWPSLL